MVVAHTGTVSLPNEKLDVQLKDTMCKKVEGIEEENTYIQKQTKCQNEVANYGTYYTYGFIILVLFLLLLFLIVEVDNALCHELINVNGM